MLKTSDNFPNKNIHCWWKKTSTSETLKNLNLVSWNLKSFFFAAKAHGKQNKTEIKTNCLRSARLAPPFCIEEISYQATQKFEIIHAYNISYIQSSWLDFFQLRTPWTSYCFLNSETLHFPPTVMFFNEGSKHKLVFSHACEPNPKVFYQHPRASQIPRSSLRSNSRRR